MGKVSVPELDQHPCCPHPAPADQGQLSVIVIPCKGTSHPPGSIRTKNTEGDKSQESWSLPPELLAWCLLLKRLMKVCLSPFSLSL